MCPLTSYLISLLGPILIFGLIFSLVIKKRKQDDHLYMQMMERQKEAVELLKEIRDLLKNK